ncbi:CLUMA_CG018453, isoform A [Clunio marinus]|uniref:CLUMA_CG018453, isoform A n=1 Tax=Clunio marinus TaxID=568069 RepID=A0A1J1J0J9_9DIPT|nr:CLUMA_CG018453, isoform A [Clunio marinus]
MCSICLHFIRNSSITLHVTTPKDEMQWWVFNCDGCLVKSTCRVYMSSFVSINTSKGELEME